MIQSVSCLAPGDIHALLAGVLTPNEVSVMEKHLTSCVACRQKMEHEVGDERWWSNVKESLGAELGCIAGESASMASQESENSRLLELLGPTDDPEMLGRIGPYEIVGLLGQGGMGVVFKGFDAALNRFVAIKMLLPQLAASGAARKRFAREAQASAAIVNDHVMAIHSVAVWQGAPYLVMPYSRGVSLQRRLNDEGPLQLREILRIGTQVASGLAAAHAQGIVHRDVKPANVFLEEGVERVALMDFGLARALDDASLTHTGTLAGTPQYMAPEQARGEAVDIRSDLFSLGAVLYATCTGHPPFRAENAYGVLRLITDHEPRAIQEINPDIPDWLCRLIARLMEKRPDDRFASAAETADLLERCLAHVQHPKRSSLPAELSEPLRPNPMSRIYRIGAIGLLATTIAYVAFFLWQSPETDRNQSENDAKVTKADSGPTRLPKDLIERLGPFRERIAIPRNASVKEFDDRYEVTASPWHTTTLLVDGDVPSRAHKEHAERHTDHKHDDDQKTHQAHDAEHEHSKDDHHTHDAEHEHSKDDHHTHDAEHEHSKDDHHTHKITQSEYFADAGKLTVYKSKKGRIVHELIGNAGFEGDQFHFSSHRVVYHLGGSNDRLILTGNARFANDHDGVRLTAEKITNWTLRTLAEGDVRLRRKAPTGKSEIISAARLEMDHASGDIKLSAKSKGGD